MYDRFRLAAKLSFRCRDTSEEDSSSSRITLETIPGSRTSHRIVVSFTSYAQKTLRDYSAPSANQVPTGPEVNIGGENFKIKMGLITMVQASPFWGKANEDIYQCSSPTVLGALQHFCYLGCISRCNLAPFVPVLSSGESEAMVLC